MGKHSNKNHNPNWKAQQQALAERSKLCRKHDDDAELRKFSDGRLMKKLDNGQLVRVYQVKDQLLTKKQLSGLTSAATK